MEDLTEPKALVSKEIAVFHFRIWDVWPSLLFAWSSCFGLLGHDYGVVFYVGSS